MSKDPPAELVERLILKLQCGHELKLSDRMIALWFVRKVRGEPLIDASEVEKYEAAMDEWVANKSNAAHPQLARGGVCGHGVPLSQHCDSCSSVTSQPAPPKEKV